MMGGKKACGNIVDREERMGSWREYEGEFGGILKTERC